METTRHKHYNIAVRAFCGTSFSPEKRGEQYCNDFEERKSNFRSWIESIETDIDKQAEIERYEVNLENAFTAYLHAHSRVMSTMITGPANFPVNSNRKKGDTADRRMSEYLECTQKAKDSIMKRVRKEQVINAGGPLEIAKNELALAKLNHERMVEANKIIRRAPKYESTEKKLNALRDIGIKDPENLFNGRHYGGTGFHGFELTNSNARIRGKEQRVKTLEMREKAETTERKINGIKIIENTEQDRLQIIFDGKPAPEIIRELKSNGFRWSPRNTAWQRQLTENARYATKRLSFLS